MTIDKIKIPILTKITKDKMYQHLIKIGRSESYALDISKSCRVQGAQKDNEKKKIWITFSRKLGNQINHKDPILNEMEEYQRVMDNDKITVNLKGEREIGNEISINFEEYMSYYREEQLNNLI